MIEFWATSALLALGAGALLLRAVWRERAQAPCPADQDMRVYRDQLAEVDRDAARGILSTQDAQLVRTEISRRILAADAARHAEKSQPPPPAGKFLSAGICCIMLIASYALYINLGVPGYGDLPLNLRIEAAKQARENRPSQEQAQASLPDNLLTDQPDPDYIALVEKLRRTVASRDNDLQGHILLTQAEARLGNFSRAAQAQLGVLRIKGAATAGDDLASYADLLILAAGGYVSPRAEETLRESLRLDPSNGTARYYWGLMHLQTGRPDLAFRFWEPLLRQGPDDAPWIAPIRAQISDTALRAGVNYTLPAAQTSLRGPGIADIDASDELSPAEQMEMIRGMVGGLSERLGTEGGSAEEWAQLISALGVLGQRDQARSIAQEAQRVFADVPGALDLITQAAERAGVQ